MNTLKLLRASAGSGKTFAIAGAYLDLLFDPKISDHKFKQILAVTFTNKATEEMKSRIIENLVYIAKGEFDISDSIIAPLLVFYNNDKQALKDRATKLLSIILHNYSYFNIKTIDSFAQNILRNFYFELKMHPAYDVELDISPAQRFLMDKLVDQAEHNENIRKWIFELIDTNIEDEKPWSFYDELKGLTYAIFTEKFHELEDKIKLLTIEDLKTTSNYIKQTKKSISQKIIQKGKAIAEIIKTNQIDISCFYYSGIGTINFPLKASLSNTNLNLDIFDQKKRFQQWISGGIEKFYKKGNEPENEVYIYDKLQPLLLDFNSLIQENKQEYYTITTLSENIFLFGLFIELADYIQEYRDENNVLFSNDVNKLLHSLIKDNDVSFIYEKAGERYQNFMIDEFQDTSTYQWEIYHPLISNSLSENHKNLIVGDIKQAIYRWREGNFNLLLNQVKEDITKTNHAKIIQEESLQYNYRSDANIISFNNHIFNYMPTIIQHIFNKTVTDLPSSNDYVDITKEKIFINKYDQVLNNIYNDTRQLIPSSKVKNPKGYISLQLLEDLQRGDIKKELISELVNSQIKELIVNQKVCPKDIVILASRKKDLFFSINSLLQYWEKNQLEPKIEVVSENALLLKDSPAVKIIQSCFQYMHDEAELHLQEICYNYSIVMERSYSITLINKQYFDLLPEGFQKRMNYWKQLSLYEGLQHILSFFGLDKLKKYGSFITAFSDKLYNYTQKNGNDLYSYLQWWEEKLDNIYVNLVESNNAIQAMTIHKSKGLAFKHVILPYADMELARAIKNENIWVNPTQLKAPYPVKYKKSLLETEFVFEYLEEMINKMVDTTNAFYVASTRAISGLHIFGSVKSKSKQKKGFSPSSISQLLYEVITNPHLLDPDERFYSPKFKLNPIQFNRTINDKEHTIQSLTLGELEHQTTIKQSIDNNKFIPILSSKNWTKLITIKKKSSQLFDEDSINKKRLEGTILHKVLSYINVESDIEQAIEKVYNAAWITEETKPYYKNIVYIIINHELVKPFFNAKKVINERTILSKDFGIKIPDRVVELVNGEYWVLDYKFSNQLAIKKHKRQIKEYQILIKEITNKPVKAGIIYYDFEEVTFIEVS